MKPGFSNIKTKNFQRYKLDLEKAEEPEIKLAMVTESEKQQGNSKKASTSAPLNKLKPVTMWITTNYGKFLKRRQKPDHLVHLLRILCAGQEATIRTGHGTTDWFKIRKGVHQACILSPCLFNLHSEYIM